tara:strand:- start:11805 stop:12935 length:1131 start_codon:yes stop_codon:yes gene_type:complete
MTYFTIAFISSLLKVQNTILQILQKIIWTSPPLTVDNIIIYKNGNIGDIITAYPAIKLIKLKYPHAKIVLLTSPGAKNLISAASILNSQNLVNEILYYYDGKIFPLFRKIRHKKFDLCFMMSDDRSTFLRELRNLFFFSFLNIKYLHGFSVNRVKFSENNFAQKIPYPYENEVQRNINTTKINDQINLFEYSHNDISDDISNNAKKLNNALIIATGAKLESKKWDDNNFFEIAKLWIRNKGDIVFIGNRTDGIVADNIILRLESWKKRTELMFKTNNYYNLCNKTTLSETIYMISEGVAMIANDSGPGHLSSFTSTKVVTIQAPQDFKLKWDPYLSKEFVLRSKRKHICSCSIDSCGYCINDITHSDAWEKLKGFA